MTRTAAEVAARDQFLAAVKETTDTWRARYDGPARWLPPGHPLEAVAVANLAVARNACRHARRGITPTVGWGTTTEYVCWRCFRKRLAADLHADPPPVWTCDWCGVRLGRKERPRQLWRRWVVDGAAARIAIFLVCRECWRAARQTLKDTVTT